MSRVPMPKPIELKRKLHAINQLLLPIYKEWNEVLEDSYTPDHGPGLAGGTSRMLTYGDPTSSTALAGNKRSKRSACKNVWHDVEVAERLLNNALNSLKDTWKDGVDDYDHFCSHCAELSTKPLKKGLCGICYPYWHRTGTLPTDEVLNKRDKRQS